MPGGVFYPVFVFVWLTSFSKCIVLSKQSNVRWLLCNKSKLILCPQKPDYDSIWPFYLKKYDICIKKKTSTLKLLRHQLWIVKPNDDFHFTGTLASHQWTARCPTTRCQCPSTAPLLPPTSHLATRSTTCRTSTEASAERCQRWEGPALRCQRSVGNSNHVSYHVTHEINTHTWKSLFPRGLSFKLRGFRSNLGIIYLLYNNIWPHSFLVTSGS